MIVFIHFKQCFKFILVLFRYLGTGLLILMGCIFGPFVRDEQCRKEAQERGEF